MAGKVKAICLSKKKGTAKIPVEKIEVIENYGFKNDAHAGSWHRQVSLLSYETREAFKQMGSTVEDGSFGENLLISGIDFNAIEVGTCLKIGDVILEITQLGKSCHNHCAIYHQVGKCIMPTNGFTQPFVGIISFLSVFHGADGGIRTHGAFHGTNDFESFSL